MVTSLRYVYEEDVEFNFGGELTHLPVTVYVYRRDFHLLWSEIKAFFRDGSIPVRYGPQMAEFGVVHEPMNEEIFRKLVRRFHMKTFTVTSLGEPETREWLIERGSGLAVQTSHNDFEHAFNDLLLIRGAHALYAMTPEQLAHDVGDHYHTWHLDAELLKLSSNAVGFEFNFTTIPLSLPLISRIPRAESKVSPSVEVPIGFLVVSVDHAITCEILFG